MQIKDIKKIKNKNEYNVYIDDKIYVFNEDIILEYKLFKDKEIDNEILSKAKFENELNDYYLKALNYANKYAKSEHEILLYLEEKGLDHNNSLEIIKKLKNHKIINDNVLIDSLIYSYIKSYNGRYLIKEKLRSKGFDFNLIDDKLNDLDMDFYIDSLNKLYEKIKDKYKKEKNDFIRINKIKKYLYQRGYSESDISKLNII